MSHPTPPPRENSRPPAPRPQGEDPREQSEPRVPELAGVCTYAEAGGPGLGVEENVRRLKRYAWVEAGITDLMLARLTATPEWEVKGGLSLHVWLAAEHARWLQARIAELRSPPHNFHLPPDAPLDAWLQECLRSTTTVELLVALYRVMKPALRAAYQRHLAETHPLVDYPTRRILRFMLLEEEEMLAWGDAALAALLTTAEARREAAAWEAHLRAYLQAAGGVSGEDEGGRMPEEAPTQGAEADPKPAAPQPSGLPEPPSTRTPEHPPIPTGSASSFQLPAPRATQPLVPDFFPRRDARFESFNYHFPPHWIYAQPDRPASERMLALVCKRLLEMDVPEMMTSILWRARQEALAAGKPKPWDYTADMCRQIWDEARHSMMGEVWLVNHGIDFTRVPLNIGFSLGLNQLATAREAHATLYWIEQGLMPRTTGKAYEWRTAAESGDALARLFMDYDWADEVLHVHIGRRWLVKEIGSREEAEKLGADAFARVMAMRRSRAIDGAAETEQREWWPDFCEDVLGYRPAPLAAEVYATPDADAPWLKNA